MFFQGDQGESRCSVSEILLFLSRIKWATNFIFFIFIHSTGIYLLIVTEVSKKYTLLSFNLSVLEFAGSGGNRTSY